MYLLDTHILLWCLEDSPLLKPQTRALIQDPNHIVFVSAVSIWEIIIKKMLGKLQIPDNLQEVIEKTGFKSLPMTQEDALTLESLPSIHADPFDRLLIAQAKRHRLTFITHDQHCIAYPIQTFNPILPDTEKWLHEPEHMEKLDSALEWAKKNKPKNNFKKLIDRFDQ